MPIRSSGSVKLFYPRFDRQTLVAALKQGLATLSARMPLRRAVLFGSWAQGRATAFSDIDLLIVYSNPPRGDAYQEVRRCMDIPGLEPHVYSETEAAQLEATITRMTAKGIALLE